MKAYQTVCTLFAACLLYWLMPSAALAQKYGPYKNDAGAAGSAKGTAVSDMSNTSFSFPMIGLGKTASVPVLQADGSFAVTYTFTVQNFGNMGLDHVQVTDVLSDVFPAPASFTIVSLTATGTLKAAAAGTYTGVAGAANLLDAASSTLAIGAQATIIVNIRVSNNHRYGVFNNSAKATATTADGTPVFDVSNNSSNPDGNGNGNPFDDKAPTPVTFSQPDIAVTKTASDRAPQVGSSITFTITAVNKGVGDAAQVAIADLLPSGYTLQSAAATRGSYDAATGVWMIGLFKTTDPLQTLTIKALVNANGAYTNTAAYNENDADNSNNTAAVTPVPVALPAPPAPTALDIQVSNQVSAPAVNTGNTVTFTITVTNNGPGDASGVQVVCPVPAAFNSVQYHTASGSTDASSGSWNIGSLASGASVGLTITATAVTPGTYNTVAVVSAAEHETSYTNNTAIATVVINQPPVAVNDAATTEEPAPVTIAVTGNDTDASGTIDNSTVTLHSQPAHGTAAVQPNGSVVYTPAEWFSGTDTFTYAVKDNNGNESNIATVTITVTTRKVDLEVVKKLLTPVTGLGVNKPIQFEITVTNLGGKTATGVVVSDKLENNIGGPEVATVTLNGTATYDASQQLLTWLIGELKPGETVTLTLTARLLSGGDITNTATVKGNEEDPNLFNNTSTVTATLDDKNDLFIPNVFTPNGDGKNDQFVIPGLNRYPGSPVIIYNRWGNMVYQSKDYKSDWTGAGLNDGTYYYVLHVNDPHGVRVYKGWVEIIHH